MIDFRIKICGIKNSADAVKAVELGADAIGLNFYKRSLRHVDLDKAIEISAAAAPVVRVGVFVNESAESINSTAEQCGLSFVQLHGDETVELANELQFPFIRAVRVSSFESAQVEIKKWSEAGASAVLLDAAAPGQYGGTGHRLDWEQVAELQAEIPVILAGGLKCDNVTQAISTAQPAAIDVASGIEKFPGSKDHDLMDSFIRAALAAFAP